jgi:hypothetical protein
LKEIMSRRRNAWEGKKGGSINVSNVRLLLYCPLPPTDTVHVVSAWFCLCMDGSVQLEVMFKCYLLFFLHVFYLLFYFYTIFLSPSISSSKLASRLHTLKILNNHSGKVI